MPEAICRQLAALDSIEVVPKSEHVYIDRAVVAGSFYQDQRTGVRHIALVWPIGGKMPALRLYVDLPSGEAFLAQYQMKKALKLLSLDPPLPAQIRRDVEKYIRRYIPLDEVA